MNHPEPHELKPSDLDNALEWIRAKYALDKRYVSSFGHLEDPWTQKIVRSKRRTMKHYGALIKAATEIIKISKEITPMPHYDQADDALYLMGETK